MLGNYLNFFREDGFCFEEYVNSMPDNKREFMEEFVKTQNFAGLVENTASCLKERNDISFFIEGVKLHEEKGKLALEKEIQKVLDFIADNHKNVSCIIIY
eukprot:TRINITY_DN8552_c0_g2_i1.p3 TRINITY_DN8552_c0_g2~~TRINITY_DN8552_c0_g2_i1.p3  ORF type:complete len:100 (+),score=18.94 TRINITY_DN8552_c0_g2_i1:73-372(+)